MTEHQRISLLHIMAEHHRNSLLHIMTEQQRISLLHNVWCTTLQLNNLGFHFYTMSDVPTALQLNNREFHFYAMFDVLHGDYTTEDFTFTQCQWLMYSVMTEQQRISFLHNVWCTALRLNRGFNFYTMSDVLQLNNRGFHFYTMSDVLHGAWTTEDFTFTQCQWLMYSVMTEQQRISLLRNVLCTALQRNNRRFHFYTMFDILCNDWTTEDFTFTQCLVYCITTKQQRVSLLHNVWCTA